MLHMRKTRLLRETITSELGRAADRPIVRAVAMTVIDNPIAGRYVEDARVAAIRGVINHGPRPRERGRRKVELKS